MRQSPLSSLLRSLGVAAIVGIAAAAGAAAQFVNIGAPITDVHHGTALWGDYDSDGQLDLVLTGQTPFLSYFTDIYRNNLGAFTPIGSGLPTIGGSFSSSRGAWGDYDGDGDIDLFLMSATLTQLFKNNGTTFPPVTVTPSPLVTLGAGSSAWGDYDNDGDLDLFYNGYSTRSYLYRNDGSDGLGGWIFNDMNAPGLYGGAIFCPIHRVANGEGVWGDYDRDGDLDMALMGYQANEIIPITKILRNDGGVMTNSGVSLVQVANGGLAWGDFDNDGYLDLTITGITQQDPFGTPYFKVYLNDGSGGFYEVFNVTPGISRGSVAVADYNNDGNLDILVNGIEGTGTTTAVTRAYLGNGTGGFTIGSLLSGVYESHLSWGDYNNDNKADLLIAGRQTPDPAISRIYRNNTLSSNTPPTAPSGVSIVDVTAHSFKVTWSPASDVQTPSAALTYNLSIKDLTSGQIVMPPMADLSTGKRFVPLMGNTNHTTHWTIGGLTSGHTYQVCVQTIDAAYIGSPFTCVPNVTLPTDEPDVMIGDCAADVGAEPNTACGAVYWNSPNIYVRNNPDGLIPGNDVTQVPITGVTNYVYVKLKNIGTATMPAGTVHAYFAKATTGFSWPTHWSGYQIGGVTYGDAIGTATVTSLSAGGDVTVQIPWNNVPDPADYGDPDAHHFCLLARFVSLSDPMAVTETGSTFDNTKNNNNIAWRNISLLSFGSHIGSIDLANLGEVVMDSDLDFWVDEAELNDPVLNHVTLGVYLPARLFQIWKNNGGLGEGFEVLQDPTGAGAVLVIKDLKGSIRKLTIEPDQRFTVRVGVLYPREFDEKVAGNIYHWHLGQYASNAVHTPIGGETYAIQMPSQPPQGTKAVTGSADLSGVLRLNAHPNPTSAGSSISYSLPADTRVTLSLYNVAGGLVRALLGDADQKAGTHTIEWDGTETGGAPAPAGTYFYRVETTEGSAQGQIRIVR